MATLEKRSGGGYRLVFWYRGKRFQGSIKATSDKVADELRVRAEGNLALLQQGRIVFNPGDDLFQLIISDGKLNNKLEVKKRVTLGDFIRLYCDNRPPDKEENTVYTEGIHFAHLLRLMGKKTPLADIPARLQDYINSRSKENGRSGKISHITIKKELGTLSSLWNQWGLGQGLVTAPLSLKNVKYPKKVEKPPFQTWDKIMAKTNGNIDSELWDCVFLSVPEIEELLDHVQAGVSLIRGHKRYFSWTHPMFAFCAYTGCRRSEMLRAKVEDVDFANNELAIREKKKDRSKMETLRHVPLAPSLHKVLDNWLTIHPGGSFLFCKTPGQPLTPEMASHYFRWAVEGSKWQVIRGFHCLRHSLISNLACKGASDHVIMGLVGHLNKETTRRYLHLRPETKENALGALFG